MLSAMPVHEHTRCRSLAEESWLEALRERWYQSERAGRDVGDCAIDYWVHYHWPGFVRARWIEHMQGECFWLEFDRLEFGILRDTPVDLRPLLDAIIEQLRCGAENLDIIRWARVKCPAERQAVRELLHVININAHRMRCFFGTAS
jgi:hypothetical protein